MSGTFEERFGHALEEAIRYQQQLALLMIDIDRYRTMLKVRGQVIADLVLSSLASRFASCIGQGDTFERIGTDEFAAILCNVSGRAAVEQVAGRMLRRIAEPVSSPVGELSVTVSVGVAVFPQDGNSTGSLFETALIALRRAKEEGRNRFIFADLRQAGY